MKNIPRTVTDYTSFRIKIFGLPLTDRYWTHNVSCSNCYLTCANFFNLYPFMGISMKGSLLTLSSSFKGQPMDYLGAIVSSIWYCLDLTGNARTESLRAASSSIKSPFCLIYNQFPQLRNLIQKSSLDPTNLDVQSKHRCSIFPVECSLRFLKNDFDAGFNDGARMNENVITGTLGLFCLSMSHL